MTKVQKVNACPSHRQCSNVSFNTSMATLSKSLFSSVDFQPQKCPLMCNCLIY